MSDSDERNGAVPEDAEEFQPQTVKRHFIYSMDSYRSVIDEQIRDAQERGDFDNLKGKGKPLEIDKNEYAGDRELAYKMLKDNGFTLPWIEARNEAIATIAAFRADVKREWQLNGLSLLALSRAGRRDMAIYRWRAIVERLKSEMDAVNRQIVKVNYIVPADRLALLELRLAEELDRVGAAIELPA